MGKQINAVKFLEKGIIYENTNEFTSSFFEKVYDQAAKLVEQIIQDNRRLNCSKNSVYNKRNADISNTISFIGRRGTGKTSAMLSFCEALVLNGYNEEKMFSRDFGMLHFEQREEMKHVNFCVLNCIDAAALEASENILTLVLANMLNKLDTLSQQQYSSDSVNQYEIRSLSQKFENIYDDFLTLRNYDQQNEYSSYEKLKNIASSQKIRNNFAVLVEEYLKYFEDCQDLIFKKKKEAYLVIVIDDLDMSHYNSSLSEQRNNKSYEIMRNINLYFSIPGVIVLVSYNHENLHRQCVDFFSDRSKSYCNRSGEERYLCAESAEMASQYMEKVLPPGLRLCMPSWKKRDYTDFESVYVNIKDLKKCSDIFAIYKDTIRLSIKKYVLLLYGEALGIYYDCEGRKRHFLEPITLRELGTITQMFIHRNDYHVDSCSNGNRYFIKTGDLYRKIKNDLYFRFIQEKLVDQSDKKLFETWMDMSIDRRGEDIVRRLSKITEPLGKEYRLAIQKYQTPDNLFYQKKIADVSTEYLRDNSMVSYSYAELVHSIYHMTRNDKRYSKALVECILHSYTFCLNKIYNDYRFEKKKIEKEILIAEYRKKGVLNHEKLNEYHQIFKHIIGETICGKWTQYYFPEVISRTPTISLEMKSASVIIGYKSNAVLNYVTEMDIDEYLKVSLQNAIYEILFVSMFFTDVFDWNDQREIITFIRENDSDKAKLKIKVSDNYRNHNFELTAFFKYTFLYGEYLEKMEKLFQKAILKMDCDNKKKEELKAFITSIFDNLWNSFYEWDKNYGNAMLPIYNLDVTYNLIKRIFLENKKKSEQVIRFDSFSKTQKIFLHEFENMLSLFINHLEKIDKYYFLEKNHKGKNNKKRRNQGFDSTKQRSFTEVFMQCPYINIILSSVKKSNDDNIGAYIQGFAKTLMDDVVDTVAPDDYY